VFEKAAVLVQPSFEEGFGMPVLEAMTVGVPVIATNRGALPEVVGDAGALIEPDDPGALAREIERLIDDPREAAAASARGLDRARRFTWEAAALTLLDGYRAAIDHRERARGLP
jgi:glycosyltransferase involved in cell wall biosynthesis